MDPFIGEIIMFGGNFAPRGWALCDGSLLPISQNQALFSILGTTYGGDGRTTFALPDLRGRAPIHAGSGPGLRPRSLGQKGGEEDVTLTSNQMPAHTHDVGCSAQVGNAGTPAGNVPAAEKAAAADVYQTSAPNQTMSSAMIHSAGGGQSHDNMQPFLAVNFIIALVGTFPSRN